MQPFGHNRHWAQNWGATPCFWGGAGSPSNKVAWSEAYLHTKWHSSCIQPFGHIEIGRKLGRGLHRLFGEGSWVLLLRNVAYAEAYLHTKWHLNPSSHLATADMGRKLSGGCVHLEHGELVPI